MPSTIALKRRPVSKLEIARMRIHDPSAQAAMDRWIEIEANGGMVEAWWSRHDGYVVVDSYEKAILLNQLSRKIP
jgi:hypothetical protein